MRQGSMVQHKLHVIHIVKQNVAVRSFLKLFQIGGGCPLHCLDERVAPAVDTAERRQRALTGSGPPPGPPARPGTCSAAGPCCTARPRAAELPRLLAGRVAARPGAFAPLLSAGPGVRQGARESEHFRLASSVPGSQAALERPVC